MVRLLLRDRNPPQTSSPRCGIQRPPFDGAVWKVSYVKRLPPVGSAYEGSGTAGWSLAAPVPACFLIEEEDIAVLSWQCKGSQWSSKGQKGVAPGRLQMIHSVRPKSHSSASQQRTRVAVPKSSVLPAPARAENAPLHAEQTAV